MKPRIIMIRENAETVTCSSCAGSLEGIDAFGASRVLDYASTERVITEVGALYMALRKSFGDTIEIDVVDPRNELYLFPTLISDYRKYRPPLGAFLKTLFLGISPASIIINGVERHKGNLPSPEALIQEIDECLASPAQAGP